MKSTQCEANAVLRDPQQHRQPATTAAAATTPATTPAAAALHLRVQYALDATCRVFRRTTRRRPQIRTAVAPPRAVLMSRLAGWRVGVGMRWLKTVRSAVPFVTAPSALLDPLCLAALNTGIPVMGALPVTLND
eukprot:365542-Chlamydomonas_euryale.AAC.3